MNPPEHTSTSTKTSTAANRNCEKEVLFHRILKEKTTANRLRERLLKSADTELLLDFH